MKHFVLILVLGLLFSSCKKSALEELDEAPQAGSVISSGVFVSNTHPTSGNVKIIRETTGKLFLQFENFSTDNGPDLRVWLSPGTNAATYLEAGKLKAVNGNFSYELDGTADYSLNNRVLIWCEDFSVLFGHAILQ